MKLIRLLKLIYLMLISISFMLINNNINSSNKTVLITGGAGFIGSNFLKYMFNKYPQYKIIVLDSLTYAGNLNNISFDILRSPRFTFKYNSILDKNVVLDVMKQADLVVHFAAETHVSRSIADSAVFFQTDVLGTHCLMESLLLCKNVQRFIHISTSEVYGTAENYFMTEEHPLNPCSPYAGAKAGADRLVYSFWSTYDVPAIIIRPFNNYGPNQHLEKMLPRFIVSAIEGKNINIHGDGKALRDWIFVEDTCRAIDLALHIENFEKIKNQVINIGTGIAFSVGDIADKISNILNLSKLKIVNISDRPGQVSCHRSSISKAYELLGFVAKTTFEDGLKKTIEWYKNNENWWRTLENDKEVALIINGKEVKQ